LDVRLLIARGHARVSDFRKDESSGWVLDSGDT
jgi:hypothetical protein